MQPDVRLAVGREILEQPVAHDHERVERIEHLLLRSLRRQHRDTDLDRHALVADVAPAREHLRGRGLAGRLRIGDECAATAPAGRVQMTALGQRQERLTQRRARDLEL